MNLSYTLILPYMATSYTTTDNVTN